MAGRAVANRERSCQPASAQRSLLGPLTASTARVAHSDELVSLRDDGDTRRTACPRGFQANSGVLFPSRCSGAFVVRQPLMLPSTSAIRCTVSYRKAVLGAPEPHLPDMQSRGGNESHERCFASLARETACRSSCEACGARPPGSDAPALRETDKYVPMNSEFDEAQQEGAPGPSVAPAARWKLPPLPTVQEVGDSTKVLSYIRSLPRLR